MGHRITVFDGQGDGLDRFSLQVAELPDHVVEKMLSGFAAEEAIAKLFMESFEFIHETYNVAFA